MAEKIYGATLTNVVFGVKSIDQGIVQTHDIEHRAEDEPIVGTKGEKLGGAKYGPEKELQIVYISNSATPTQFDLTGADVVSKLTFNGTSWELFNVRESQTNTGFLTFTATARFSPDWGGGA